MKRLKYQKREDQIVLGVQINLDTEGITFNKWGGKQQCSSGDWLINNDGECYTVKQDTFESTYKEIAPAQFLKIAPVWAVKAVDAGRVKTEEGYTSYVPGDYIVAHTEDGSDAYAVTPSKFEKMYKRVD